MLSSQPVWCHPGPTYTVYQSPRPCGTAARLDAMARVGRPCAKEGVKYRGRKWRELLVSVTRQYSPTARFVLVGWFDWALLPSRSPKWHSARTTRWLLTVTDISLPLKMIRRFLQQAVRGRSGCPAAGSCAPR